MAFACWPSSHLMVKFVRLAVASAILRGSLVEAAIGLDGKQVAEPLAGDDPSPLGDINTYYPDQHDCPLPCVDNGNMHSWVPYFSVDRLNRCQEPMLLQFSVTQPLDDPESSILIRSCSLNHEPAAGARMATAAGTTQVENPKKSHALAQGSTQVTAPACAVNGTEVSDKVTLHSFGGKTKSLGSDNNTAAAAVALLEGMYKFFNNDDNCDEKFVFGYHRQTAVGAYIGAGLGKPTMKTILKALKTSLSDAGKFSGRSVVAQLCDSTRQPERIVGVSIDASGDLAAVQRMGLDWSNGKCSGIGQHSESGSLVGAKVYDIAGANLTLHANNITGTNANGTASSSRMGSRVAKYVRGVLQKKAVCRYERVLEGDGCGAIAERCHISPADFTKYNPDKDFCATLQPGGYACCSSGDPYKPPKPQPEADGTCKTHLISNGDSCGKLAQENGITVDEIEKWNKGKTWAWTECKDMLQGYNMCLSEGTAPMPPPQEGTQCGPLVPGTKKPSNKDTSLADLNPCPLKACCSNWGFCGVFPAHCAIHAPEGGGPGSKMKGYQNTCVSNCGNEIKKNSGPPATFQRVGYYEAFGMERECLTLKAKHANTDGSYTHIHWAFASIDPQTWKPVIEDKKDQWKDFKELKGVKRIVSFGGWAFSTEPSTFDVIRQAILKNRDTFAENLAKFANDEGLDGIDIDWEYPGAPDILVDGKPIGQKGDGVGYLKFLTVLKNKLGDKSVSIAAPASYWYLQAFPIDRIAKVIDYIVYMTYDLHGQWDYGNPNAYDMCGSGKCIRSHVNLTETSNSLAMITKAGVPNNKIFVGEASYGRSFHMAQDGCWGPLCDFTGSRTSSDAKPGRCTKTGGYISYAEINEIIKRGGSEVRVFHDGESNSDIMLNQGDYISYMTPTTKDTRREDWKGLNFAGSIDWAVDLQSFTSDDFENLPDRPKSGQGCIAGDDLTINSGSLCQFTCGLGFCPETLCICTHEGKLRDLPKSDDSINARAVDEFDVDLNRLCNFSCKYGVCPDDVCNKMPPEDSNSDKTSVDPSEPTEVFDYKDSVRKQYANKCYIYKDPKYFQNSLDQCYNACYLQIQEAKEAGETANYGCVGFFPLDKPIPWTRALGSGSPLSADGTCSCNNPLVNFFFETFIEGMAAIAQIGCFIIMSTLKSILDIGLELFPAGRVLSAGLDAVTNAVKLINHVYDNGEDPEGAWQWWLSPCGGTDLVPDDLKTAFDIIGQVTDMGSLKIPKKLKKGSGKKGDKSNPGTGGTRKPSNPPPKQNGNKKKQCNPGSEQLERLGGAKNTLRVRSCDKQHQTHTTDFVVTSMTYEAQATAVPITKECNKGLSQACFHYSSANRHSPRWGRLTCPQEAATTSHRERSRAVGKWSRDHGDDWKDPKHLQNPNQVCQIDEWPPAYFLRKNDDEMKLGGKDPRGQRVRYLPMEDNQGAGQLWRGVCMKEALEKLTNSELEQKVKKAKRSTPASQKVKHEELHVGIDINHRPEFSLSWGHSANPPADDGLFDNICWPSQLAVGDPGFALLILDEWYSTNPKGGKTGPRWNYKAPYVKGTNGD
ncbi:hypothetical protein QQS21_004893 [Conoideocrella luteorostrata]|uniref:chitinase n=1 Tax=Conoideocrella luteorostrata TaxID=1105319 RepID=A0AAJ0FZJ4_9HYPO|nr:hypothetical protein QQS21_004893 [Conoideocrella luteorostrata]